MSVSNKRTFKISMPELVAVMVFLGKKVTPEDVTNHLYNEKWGDGDKYLILEAVRKAFKDEMAMQEGPRPENHYGLCKSESYDLYWLDYNIRDIG